MCMVPSAGSGIGWCIYTMQFNVDYRIIDVTSIINKLLSFVKVYTN